MTIITMNKNSQLNDLDFTLIQDLSEKESEQICGGNIYGTTVFPGGGTVTIAPYDPSKSVDVDGIIGKRFAEVNAERARINAERIAKGLTPLSML